MTSAALTDRERVERMLLAEMFADLVRSGSRDLTDTETAETLAILDRIIDELLDGLPYEKRRSAIKRTGRMVRAFSDFRRRGRPVAEFGLCAYYFTRLLTENDLILIGAASDFSKALNRILPALQDAGLSDGVHWRCERGALEAMRKLNAEGYFPGFAEIDDGEKVAAA